MSLLKDWKIPQGCGNVRYKVLDEEDKHISYYIFSNGTACFSAVTYGLVPANARSILVWWSKEYTPYTLEQRKQWLRIIRAYGMPVWFEKEEENIHYFRVNLYTDDNQPINRFILVSALSLLRVLYEINLNYIPANFFELKKLLPNERNLYLLQVAHFLPPPPNAYAGNWNHAIKTTATPTQILSIAEFKELRGDVKNYDIFLGNRVSLISSWKDKGIINPETDPVKLYYQVCKASGI
jgi:hypothetical protein